VKKAIGLDFSSNYLDLLIDNSTLLV